MLMVTAINAGSEISGDALSEALVTLVHLNDTDRV
jgi:hypothetical protein